MSVKVYRSIRLALATGELRTAEFRRKSHIVVPVVALVEGVVHASNSENPEFVPRGVLKHLPAGWNGRPVTAGHPAVSGKACSANDPRILELYQFGHVFNARVPEDRLLVDAYLDPDMVEMCSMGADRIVERLQKKEVVEVSVGAYVILEDQSGTYKGKQYKGVWSGLVQDHLAFLQEGDIGACSIEAGCGALRSASVIHVVTENGLVELPGTELRAAKESELMAATNPAAPANPQPAGDKSKDKRNKFLQFLDRFRNNAGEDGAAVSDIYRAVDAALRAVEPGYLGIDMDGLFLDAQKVVYAVMPQDEYQLFRRSFTRNGEGSEVTLADDREEVKQVRSYEPVTASTAAPTHASGAPCGCHKQKQNTNTQESEMTKETRVNALIGSGRFVETDRTFLMGLEENVLQTLESRPVPPKVETPAPAAPVPAPAAAPQAPQTLEQYIDNAPAAVKETLRAATKAISDRKAALIQTLKANSKNKFTDEQLNAKPVEELEQLVELAGTTAPQNVVDFSGRGAPRAASVMPGSRDEQPEAPPSLVTAIQNAGKKQTA